MKLLVTLLLCSVIYIGQAQEEKGWFKRLFEKEDANKEEVKDAPADSLDFLLNEFLKGDSIKDSSMDSLPNLELPGNGEVTLISPNALQALDAELKENPMGTKGYRIQIFFGKIDAAKEARVDFIRRYPSQECNMEHVPPNFSVQVGAFTDKLEAYRHMKGLKGNYPDAILIPATIEPEPKR